MRAISWKAAFAFSGIFFFAHPAGTQQHKLESTAQEPGTQAQAAPVAPQFRQIAGAPEGAQEARLFALALPQVHARLEIQMILVPGGKPLSFVAENEGVFELRTGSLATLSEGKTEKREAGEIWQVAKSSRITLQASGELAVVRAIYLVTATP